MLAETGRRRRGRVSVTSLIDVIFLLLLFFMLTSTFSRFSELELSATGGGAAATAGEVTTVFLSLSPDQLLVNGTPTELDALDAAIQALATDGTTRVLISPGKVTDAQRLVDLMAVLKPLAGRQGLSITVLG